MSSLHCVITKIDVVLLQLRICSPDCTQEIVLNSVLMQFGDNR